MALLASRALRAAAAWSALLQQQLLLRSNLSSPLTCSQQPLLCWISTLRYRVGPFVGRHETCYQAWLSNLTLKYYVLVGHCWASVLLCLNSGAQEGP